MRPARFEIRVDGLLTDEQLEELSGMTVVGCDGRFTVLHGVVPDQPALAGIVVALETYGSAVSDIHLTGPVPAPPAGAVAEGRRG